MIPFGLLADTGNDGSAITALAEEGFQIRLGASGIRGAENRSRRNWRFMIIIRHRTIGFRSAMHAWCMKKGAAFLQFNTSLHTELEACRREGTAPCDAIQPLYPLEDGR